MISLQAIFPLLSLSSYLSILSPMWPSKAQYYILSCFKPFITYFTMHKVYISWYGVRGPRPLIYPSIFPLAALFLGPFFLVTQNCLQHACQASPCRTSVLLRTVPGVPFCFPLTGAWIRSLNQSWLRFTDKDLSSCTVEGFLPHLSTLYTAPTRTSNCSAHLFTSIPQELSRGLCSLILDGNREQSFSEERIS